MFPGVMLPSRVALTPFSREFHQRAERLGVAAAAHDPELVAFHYSRLVESCALCHAAFAKSRFPGFSSPAQQGHHH
jgi:hypothetical protein